MNEEWRDIEGYEGVYQISNLGRVKSLDRMVGHNKGGKKLIRGKLKRAHIAKNGYPMLNLSNKNRQESVYLHRILGKTFLPNPRRLETINHKDGNKENFDLSNLEWASHSENISHAYRTGLRKPTRILDDCIVLSIITFAHKRHTSQQSLANCFGVTRSCVQSIVRRNTWKHMPWPTLPE